MIIYAVVVGNDAYEYVENLPHSRADARAYANYLRSFPTARIELLLDARRSEYLDALRAAVRAAEAPDRIVDYFSGHGALIRSYGGVESDGMSEVLLPIDYDTTPRSVVFDRDVFEITSQVRPGVLVTHVIDACHGELYDEDRVPERKFLHVDRCPDLCFSGCRSAQTASSGDGDLSVFTDELLATLANLSGTTWIQIAAEVVARVGARGYPQVPQIHGPAFRLNSYPP